MDWKYFEKLTGAKMVAQKGMKEKLGANNLITAFVMLRIRSDEEIARNIKKMFKQADAPLNIDKIAYTFINSYLKDFLPSDSPTGEMRGVEKRLAFEYKVFITRIEKLLKLYAEE